MCVVLIRGCVVTRHVGTIDLHTFPNDIYLRACILLTRKMVHGDQRSLLPTILPLLYSSRALDLTVAL